MNIELLFDRYLQLSEVKRPGYIESLGLPEPNSTQQLELAAGTPLAPLLVLSKRPVCQTQYLVRSSQKVPLPFLENPLK